MYGLEVSADLSFLMGMELLQLCIGLYRISLNFTDQVVITIESTSRLVTPNTTATDIPCDSPELAGKLVCLLGASITEVINKGEGELRLIFSNGYSLQLFDEYENLESYMISSPDNTIIV